MPTKRNKKAGIPDVRDLESKKGKKSKEKVLKADEQVDITGEPQAAKEKDEDKALGVGEEVDIAEEPKPDELTINQHKNIERELRRYIAVAGGYADDLSADRKKRCSALLKKIGRESDDLERDYTLIAERE